MELLRCFARDAAPADAAQIVEREYCQLEDVVIQFKLDEATWLVGMHVDMGRPQPWQDLEACRRALELQSAQGTPAIWLLGRNLESGHLVLLCHFLMGQSTTQDADSLLKQAQVCCQVAKGLRTYLYQ